MSAISTPATPAYRLSKTLLACLIFASVLAASSGWAATLTWSGSATATWSTTATNWNGASGSPWNSSNGSTNIADFNTSALNAAVSGTVYTNGIIFDTAGTLTGGTINLAGTAPTITSNASGTIYSILAGSAGLTTLGSGTLTLGGSESYSGATTINAGTLLLSGTGTALNSTSWTVNAGATLTLDNDDITGTADYSRSPIADQRPGDPEGRIAAVPSLER